MFISFVASIREYFSSLKEFHPLNDVLVHFIILHAKKNRINDTKKLFVTK